MTWSRIATVVGRAAAACALLTFVAAGVTGCKGKAPPSRKVVKKKKVVVTQIGIVVYMSGGRIWKMEKGAKPEPILDGANWFPAVNPAGNKIAYWKDDGDMMALFVMNLISREVVKIGEWFTLGALGRNLNVRNAPCWHPRRDVDILYFADGKQIWQVNGDGTNLETVYAHSGGGCYSVSVSPKATRFVFVGVGEHDQNLWVYSLASRRAEPITTYSTKEGLAGAPAWSPKSSLIAYVFYSGDQVNISSITSDGGGMTEVTVQGRTSSPQWDSTGDKLIVTSGAQDPLSWQVVFMSMATRKFQAPPVTDARSGAFAPSIAGDW